MTIQTRSDGFDEQAAEANLRRIAGSRFIRRTLIFLVTTFGATILARFSTDLVGAARSAGITGNGWVAIPENKLFEYGFSAFVLAILLHLAYTSAVMAWRWRVFVPLLESRRPEEVAISLINLTSIFAKSQRIAQSRSLVGAGAVVFGIVKLFDAGALKESFDVSNSLVLLTAVAIGVVILLASFWLRYGFPYSRVVLVPLLTAVVGAELSPLDDSVIATKVEEIMGRVRAQRPWWFYQPAWFY